jgi:hypothetical protein
MHLRPSSSGWRKTPSPWRRHSGSSSGKRMPWCAYDTSPGVGMCPLPIRPTAEIVCCGAQKGRVVASAVRAPVRPATRWMHVVPRASTRVIAGKIVVSCRTRILVKILRYRDRHNFTFHLVA